MRSRAIGAAAFGILIVAFVVDALTPQPLVIAILLDVPIVLAALTRSRRLTAVLVVAALSADVLAAFVDASHDAFRWDPIGVGNRILSLFSIVLVGYLSTAVQERAERVGRLAAQEARARREAALSAAGDRIRASLSLDVVMRAVVREAPGTLQGEGAIWYPARDGEILAVREGAGEVDVVDERPAPEIATLIERVTSDGAATVVRAVDPVARFVLDRLGSASALAIPIADRGQSFGVLLVTSHVAEPDESLLALARGYAALAGNALAQGRLFDELAERNEALLERQSVIRDLVDAISHDLRTPLAALAMTLRQAADGAYGALPDRYATVLRDSRVAIDDLQALAETLLLVARFESGQRPLRREPVDVEALLREVSSEMQAMAAARGVTLTAETQPAATRGSRADLRRAVANLVANALQHTPAGGSVALSEAVLGNAIEIRVVDDGFGVEPAMRRALFERFSHGSRGPAGAGLGLYIVRRIAEESGGSVRYEPREPRGSVFAVRLPKAPP